MKKILALLLVLCMVVAAVGCSSKPAAQEAAAPAAAEAAPAAAAPAAAAPEAAAPEAAGKPANEYKVVALLSGVITDNGWNQICYESAKAISEKYNKSVAQLCIRWCLQNETLPLPKSITPARILQNTEVFDFVSSFNT